ncbi:hypothetical protein PF010_g18141 [Phytophthora fragariae]|uniref:Uncharacterized protein n=1 Tax=Phytophthora fragariae TaxID=53985 RepID=A0A6A3SR33_9STRA|nr:hypothetical protein PF003_g15895 [Phytophthora fragariae]KAE8900103.1 hypothetical protein PF003_g15892 [Phytophthora fragariae]KAE8936596.1 hypothetical protein PF009_g13485 [Phytophthora fragariae]KAE8936599.1 hypothetical protein PF009_g13482 [Phytophthora fragariae]KAE9086475.1 hypothetical protein PF007_g20762 [Phytophthora fragariae]
MLVKLEEDDEKYEDETLYTNGTRMHLNLTTTW